MNFPVLPRGSHVPAGAGAPPARTLGPIADRANSVNVQVVAEPADTHRPDAVQVGRLREGWSACRDWFVPYVHDSREGW